MHNVLVVDPDPILCAELRQRFPGKHFLHAEDANTALELTSKIPATFDLVLLRQTRVRKGPDTIMLLQILSLHAHLKHTRFAVVMNSPCDKRDALAAYAAGASMTLGYPPVTEATTRLALSLIKLLYQPNTPSWGPWFSSA